MCSGNEHQVPSCLQQWYQWWPMESYNQGTYLSVHPEHPYHGNPHKSCGWTGCPANQVLPVVHPTRTSEESNLKPQKGWVLEALDLQSLQEWPELEQNQARELLLRWENMFACSDLDLGKTVLDQTQDRINRLDALQGVVLMYTSLHVWWCEGPYSGDARYWSICKLHSPWASTVVLVQIRMAVWGSVLTWGSWTTRLWRMHTHYPTLTKCLLACKALSGCLPLNWSQDTGRLRWMRKANHWLHSQWGHWASMSVRGHLSDSPVPLLCSRG